MALDIESGNYDYVIGIDPGNHGGLCVIEIANKDNVNVIPMPIIKKVVGTKKKPKNKTELDDISLVSFFKQYKDKKVLIGLELVHSMPGEGSVSSFGFGASWGTIKGICRAFEFDLQIISPVSWKNSFDELETEEMTKLRMEMRDKKEELKSIDKKEIKEKKKEIDKINRSIKSRAKSAARELAAKKVPKLSNEFLQVNSDGKAESLLIALFLIGKIDELVSGGKK